MRTFSCRVFAALLLALIAGGCATTTTPEFSAEKQAARVAMLAEIPNEPPGDYFIGRRYYKRDYKFWGYIRAPRQPWSAAKLVMLNEQQTLAPDRAAGKLGSDHDTEYKVFGYFSGDTVYEPASNGFYPEFVFKSAVVKQINPAPIFRTAAANDPTRRVIGQPF